MVVMHNWYRMYRSMIGDGLEMKHVIFLLLFSNRHKEKLFGTHLNSNINHNGRINSKATSTSWQIDRMASLLFVHLSSAELSLALPLPHAAHAFHSRQMYKCHISFSIHRSIVMRMVNSPDLLMVREQCKLLKPVYPYDRLNVKWKW